ncbi:fatty acid desaturase [Phlyctema vagabunda]|uniref:Delta 8-(E)-sphingolipid desaturase n=1 Tax=Phlyctema vagabunda TaxID=108571 RepID=A0ABR4PXY9_9HELO
MAEKRHAPLLLRREIEGLIAAGGKIFILDQFVIKADPWILYHPGGEKAIQHMVGRDATDEVTALHSAEAKQQMNRYRIGRIQGRWTNFLPPIQGGKYRTLTDKTQDEYQINATTSSATSSDKSSCDSSSSFNSNEPRLRSRHSESSDSISSSVGATKADDGIAHLDSVTREEIKLDLETYPSLDHTTQDSIVAKYRLLNDRIKAEGLYQCNYGAYAIELVRYSLLFAGMLLFLHWGWYVASGIFMGAFWHQLVFAGYDAGHIGITHKFQVDSLIGIFIADFVGGLSIGWWKRNHNVHHIVTNSPEHDPDTEYLPLLAISHRFLHSLRSTYYNRILQYDKVARFGVKFQKYTYYPLMIFGRFNLYRLSWEYLLGDNAPRKGPARWHRHLEIAGQVFFWTWYGYGILYKSISSNWGRLAFFMISHMVVAPLHVQLTLSHFAMSTADLGPHESFPQKMLRTTMDVDCPPWLDFFHGGLQFQAIHHLYPRMPRHNLRRAQKLVQEFCNEVGIPYALYGFVDSNKQVVGRLADVSRQAAILAKCQSVIVNSRDS